MCEAVNLLQETPWRINTRIRELLETAWNRKEPLAGISPSTVPGTLIGQAEANEITIAQQIAIARRMAGEAEEFYFPYQLDWRGRAYSVPQVTHPQADDSGRALIEFSRAKPLGERGAYWLAVHLANLFGMDKCSFGDRVAWVEEHREEILDSARRPLDGARFWVRADKPWRFLAAALEWAECASAGLAFESRLPIAMDGTCNGLQHLSALGRDPEGGRLTNLLPSPKPQDIYQEVADRLIRLVDEARPSNDLARQWWGAIDRALVKRPTMTTPYGITHEGIRQHLATEIKIRRLPGILDPWEAAVYLAPLLRKAIDLVVVKATDIMHWLKDVSRKLAKKNRSVRWVTPAGFPVRNEYFKQRVRRVDTVMCRYLIYVPQGDGKVDSRDQAKGIVANFVHSFDAAHMLLTVRELHVQGIRDYGMVHDSYAVHAPDVDRMNRILRERFIRLYEEFTLEGFAEQIRKANPDVKIPDPSQQGHLDLCEVARSEYFFS